ncbi:MAG: hypothetical protein ABS52_15010 [Gemmatimonadetes bacterium SCN 70-22]|nr:MAG: hypothetical protein ABS52_15010 [Gemmatimonadetes bacterium SCN 70-22]
MTRFGTVLFDCDSTLSTIEGIDELAREYRDQIVPLTELAMRGEVTLESVYGRRLAIIRPSREDVERVGRMYVETLVAGAREVVRALHEAGVAVHVISGGLRPAVLHAARALGIPDGRVHAVDVYFDDAGRYAGFDEASPLARQGGKAELVESLGDLPRPSMLVGDGATDLEAKPRVDRFVAFAGVEARPHVVAAADAVVRAPSLLPVLALALGEADHYPVATRDLIVAGRVLLGEPSSLPRDSATP